MSLRTMFAGLLAAAALILALIIYQISNIAPPAIPTPAATAPPPLQVSYLVTAHPLPAGSLLRDSDFTTKSGLPDQVPAGAQPDTQEVRANLRGALVPRYLDAGVALRIQDVLRPRDRGFLATVLSAGARAVSVAVDAVTGVSGLIWPGDRVDVILTQEVDPSVAPPSRRIMSQTVLTEVRVIAVDQQIVQGATGDGTAVGKVARTVTLEVSPAQAELLTVAQRLGALSLSIRPFQEADPTENSATSTGAVYGGDVSPELTHGVVPGSSVQLIQGDQRSEVKFR